MTGQYLFSCTCGNWWVGKKEKAQCSQENCFKMNKGIDVRTINYKYGWPKK